MAQVARSGMKTLPPSRLPQPVPNRPTEMGYKDKRKMAEPTKLELMQMKYQEKLHREKEKRMMEINLQEEERNLRFDGGSNRSMVKDFFKERREMANNGYTPNIHQHFNQKKAEISGNSTYSNQYKYKKQFNNGTRPPQQHKNSAGRDKANPLAPIERHPKLTDNDKKSRKSSAASNGSFYSQNGFPRKGLNLSRKSSFGSGANTPLEFEQKRDLSDDIYEDDEKNAFLLNQNSSSAKKTSFKQWQEKQKKIREKQHLNSDTKNHSTSKMSDFEKWQAEQDQERLDRLNEAKQLNGFSHTPPPSNRSNTSRSYINVVEGSPGRTKRQFLKSHINTQSKKKLYASSSSSKPVSDSGSDEDIQDVNQEMLQKQRELEGLLRKQQEELQKMKRQREAEEEQERLAAEREAKRVVQQRERQRKIREAEEKRQKETEDKLRKEQEKREKDEQDRKWVQEEKQRLWQQSNNNNIHENKEKVDPNWKAEAEPASFIPNKPARVKMMKNRQQPLHRHKIDTPDDEPMSPKQNASKFYEEQITSNPESQGTVDLAPCHMCGRKFARDRLEKHMNACQSGQKKKRKVFDPVKMRVEGTEMAQFVDENKRRPQQQPPKKKANWRAQHEDFIKTIRYAKQVTAAEKTGNFNNLPAPPKSENPDYIQCPHCNRKFNEAAAERHIPRCKDIKSRPPPLKRR